MRHPLPVFEMPTRPSVRPDAFEARVAEWCEDGQARADPRPVRDLPPGTRPVALEALVRAAGLPVVWSGSGGLPEIQLYPGPEDLLVVPRDGVRICCVGAGSLPAADPERAREACCRLAYGYLNWAAHAALARRHADIKRELGCPPDLSMGAFLLSLQSVEAEPGARKNCIVHGSETLEPRGNGQRNRQRPSPLPFGTVLESNCKAWGRNY